MKCAGVTNVCSKKFEEKHHIDIFCSPAIPSKRNVSLVARYLGSVPVRKRLGEDVAAQAADFLKRNAKAAAQVRFRLYDSKKHYG